MLFAILADSLYGESGSNFLNVLYELKLNFALRFVVTMWSGYQKSAHVRCNSWREFERVFSDGKTR